MDAVVDRLCALAARGPGRCPRRRTCRIPPASASPRPARWIPWRGVVLAPPNLAGWRDVPLVERVEAALGLPAFLERDTNVAVMAEWRHGAAREARDVIYITVSTGIGGGIVVDGRPLIGPDGTAGEVGPRHGRAGRTALRRRLARPRRGDRLRHGHRARGSRPAGGGTLPEAGGRLRRLGCDRARRRARGRRPPTRATPPARPCWTAPGWPSARCAPAWSTS